MKIKKPKFWDYKRPNFLSYFLLPLTFPLVLNNYFINSNRNNSKKEKIKTICVGNIYVGGTAKTPLSIKLNNILKKLNFQTAVIKKFYKDQTDEQKLLSNKTKLYCQKTRREGLNKAINDKIEVAIFDDGLQDRSIKYDLSFVCFNSVKWIGNGLLIPAGPLREKIESLSNHDAVFLNGNDEDNTATKFLIKKYNQNIKIFETYYNPTDIDKFNITKRYLIFSGIGNPDSFKKTLLKNKFNIIKELKFPDHYYYNQKDIDNIKSLAQDLDATILTTEKDYVKLSDNNSKGIKFLEIELVIRLENELINFMKSKI